MKTIEQQHAETLKHADALAALNTDEAVWQALKARFELALDEANDFASNHDTPEEKRAGWAGRERGLRDLWEELVNLQNGVYRREATRKGKASVED